MATMLGHWWTRRDPVSARNGWVNAAIGAVCGVSALLDLRLGLESLGRWYLGYFAVVLIGWGVVAVARGREEDASRPIRLAGDLLGWAGLIGFAVIGLLLDPAEYPALITVVGFALMVVVIAVMGRRSGRT